MIASCGRAQFCVLLAYSAAASEARTTRSAGLSLLLIVHSYKFSLDRMQLF
jgi:hypothetical protein